MLENAPFCLVADDNELVRHALIRSMRDFSHGTCLLLEAADGAEAVNLARSHAPHLILAIVDEDMPIITGLHVAEQIKLFCQHAEVVLFTAHEHDRSALASRGIHYFQKNAEVGKLMSFCEHVLENIAFQID